MENQIKTLQKKLYLAARQTLHPAYQRDSELVKIKRDAITKELFGKWYNELNEKELLKAINECGRDYERQYPESTKALKTATTRQLQLLQFLALQCAFEYADWENQEFAHDGAYFSGADLKSRIKKIFDAKKRVPQAIIRWLFQDYINPHCNKFLIEAGLKRDCKNMKAFNFNYLTSANAQALINRFSKISEELMKRNTEFLTSQN
jgi:hypothetical protein